MTEYNAHINVWHPLWACLQEERMSLLKQVNLYKRDNFVLIFTPSSSSPTATTTTTSSKKRLLEREICNVIKMSIRYDAIKLLTQ